MTRRFWNPFSVVVACGLLLTLDVGGAQALIGVAAGLYLCGRWFGRDGRS